MTGQTGFNDYPLTIGSEYGLRSFKVDQYGRLNSAGYGNYVWKPRENVAKCGLVHFVHDASNSNYACQYVSYQHGCVESRHRKRDPKKHSIPSLDCMCGFWSYHNGDNDYATPGNVSGVVEIYGRTIVGTKGYRSEKAKIVALSLNLNKSELQRNSKGRLVMYGKRKVSRAAEWMARKRPGGWFDALIGIPILGSIGAAITLFFLQAWLVASLLTLAVVAVILATNKMYDTNDAVVSLVNRMKIDNPNFSLDDVNDRFIPDNLQWVIDNYQGIPVFDTVEDMLKEFPVARLAERPSLRKTPQNTPDFWEL